MGCGVTDHAKKEPEWGIENADKLCVGECHDDFGRPCPHYYEDGLKGIDDNTKR